MSASIKKPRADSALKTLSEERQADVIELMRKRTIAEARKELEKDGLKTSDAALSNFWSWWHLRQQFTQAERWSEDMVELLKEEQPGLSAEALERYGNRVFQARALALEQADPEAAALIWHRMQKLNLQGEMVKLERAKFQRETCRLFLEWNQDARAKEIANDPGLEQSQKIEALGQHLFKDLWDIPQQGGK